MAGFRFGNSQPVAVQFTNSSEVTVTHNLGYLPVVWVVVNNRMHFAEVQYTSINQIVCTFQKTITGTVYVR